MELVVDANVLFAAFIKESHTRHLLLNSGCNLFIPDFFFEEFNKHQGALREKTGLSEDQLRDLMSQILVFGNIRTVSVSEYSAFLEKAKMFSLDIADVPYFALALKLGCAIWSNDKKLQEQKVVKVQTTAGLGPSKH